DRQRGLALALEPRPQISRRIALALDPELAEELGEERARLPPGLGPGDPPGAAGAAGSPIELAQVGDDAGGVDRRARAHSARRSRRSPAASCSAAASCVRAPPAPITARPGARIITSPPSSVPAVIIPRIGIAAS